MRIFGIDPGSQRTGYGCIESDGRRHHLIDCGAVQVRPAEPFPSRLAHIHRELARLLAAMRPDCVAVESLFSAANARSALRLGHARGVAMLAAVQAGCEVVEYTPAEVKRAVVGYGRADKQQVQQMVRLLLGLAAAPTPHDAADALAVAICHLHTLPPGAAAALIGKAGRADSADPTDPADPAVPRGRRPSPPTSPGPGALRSWRRYRPPAQE